MSEALKEVERAWFGGHDAGDLYIADHGEGPCATMNLMDADYDPLRITFGAEGEACLHTDGCDWVSLTKSQLRFIASRCDAGARMTRSCYSDDGDVIWEQNANGTRI